MLLLQVQREAEMFETNRAKLEGVIQTNNKDLTTMKHNLQMADMKIKVSPQVSRDWHVEQSCQIVPCRTRLKLWKQYQLCKAAMFLHHQYFQLHVFELCRAGTVEFALLKI